MSENSVLTRNLVLTAILAAVAAYALHTGHETVASAAVAFITGLWIHSGRGYRQGGDPPPPASGAMSPDGAGVPVLCLAFLAFGACDSSIGGFTYEIGARATTQRASAKAEYDAQAGLLVDLAEFRVIATPTCTSGRACIYADNSNNLLYTQDANNLVLKLHAAQQYRTSADCSALSSPANGDVCYDTTLTAFRYYAAGWTTAPVNDSLLVHKAGVETITGVKTFSAAPVFGAGLTASGAVANDFSGGTGTFLTSTGANTLSGTTTLAANKNLVCAAGTTAFDFSLGTGTFLTPTGAHTINGAVTFAANKGIAYTAGTGAADFSNGTGVFKTTTGAITLGTGNITVSGPIATDVSFLKEVNHSISVVASTTAATAGGNLAISSANGNGAAGGNLTLDTGSGTAGGSITIGATNANSVAIGRSGQTTTITGPLAAAVSLTIASAPVSANFFRTCTITSAAAATPVNCLSAGDVPASQSAKLAKWHAYVNGGTGWSTTATCTIEDTAGNDLITMAVAALTANTFVHDASANVTKEARYRLGTGGANDAGIQLVCDANGTGSDLVVVIEGMIQ